MMTGEGPHIDGHAVQPGGRPAAPGRLALVQAYVNSFFDLEGEWGADLFDSPYRLAGWLSTRGLLPAGTSLRDRDRARAIDVREGLRGLAAGNNDAGPEAAAASLAEVNRAAAGARVAVLLEADGPRFTATGTGLDRALGIVLAITGTAMLEGTWQRLKTCPGHHCGWAFYDHSRNQTGRWCSMSVCGGRAKAKTHYQRAREGDQRR
jgi:predicted RNA-binding Zn ribbon-like protein